MSPFFYTGILFGILLIGVGILHIYCAYNSVNDEDMYSTGILAIILGIFVMIFFGGK